MVNPEFECGEYLKVFFLNFNSRNTVTYSSAEENPAEGKVILNSANRLSSASNIFIKGYP